METARRHHDHQRTPQPPANAEWVKLGTTLGDQIHQSFERFVGAETKLRDARLLGVRRMKLIIACAGIALGILLVVTIVYQVRRQMMELASSYRDALKAIEQRQAAWPAPKTIWRRRRSGCASRSRPSATASSSPTRQAASCS